MCRLHYNAQTQELHFPKIPSPPFHNCICTLLLKLITTTLESINHKDPSYSCHINEMWHSITSSSQNHSTVDMGFWYNYYDVIGVGVIEYSNLNHGVREAIPELLKFEKRE